MPHIDDASLPFTWFCGVVGQIEDGFPVNVVRQRSHEREVPQKKRPWRKVRRSYLSSSYRTRECNSTY
jgi:hypothetical protein